MRTFIYQFLIPLLVFSTSLFLGTASILYNRKRKSTDSRNSPFAETTKPADISTMIEQSREQLDSPEENQFKYACFISYRMDKGNRNPFINEFVRELRDDLENELELLFEPEMAKVYLDEDGNSEDKLESEALCRSVCMLCLLTPTYFSVAHPHSAREFLAMENLEKARLRRVKNPTSGLIIPVAIRGREFIPQHISRKRSYVDFSAFFSMKDTQVKSDKYFYILTEIASYIYNRYLELCQLKDSHIDCNNFLMPSDEEVSSWLSSLK